MWPAGSPGLLGSKGRGPPGMPSSLCPGGQKRTAGRWDRPGPRGPLDPLRNCLLVSRISQQLPSPLQPSITSARRALLPSRFSPPSAGKGLCDDITAETRGLPALGPGTPERRLTGVARKDNAFQVSPSQSLPSKPALSAPFTSNFPIPRHFSFEGGSLIPLRFSHLGTGPRVQGCGQGWRGPLLLPAAGRLGDAKSTGKGPGGDSPSGRRGNVHVF
ncbi:uncharacterized protein LOC116660161 [Camelus ferus]|uniref:Uncharacterized protein LOC116660161 n=1 Tax=Camelus ferus TaxID=419612 RepID=A0A8B8S512_CAMFR|nr:uncharacterized protein LOC116660161 [Camelus ferus]